MLSAVLGVVPWRLFVSPQSLVEKPQVEKFLRLLEERSSGRPLAYVLGQVGFFNFELKTDSRALIPRPETELLVEESLRKIDHAGVKEPRVLDLCCGSGNICLALARERPAWRLYASDISTPALALARENAQLLELEGRVDFRHGDLFAPWPEGRSDPFDLIVCNPPYVAGEDWAGLPDEVRLFEPRPALDGGEGGLKVIAAVLAAAPAYLRFRGQLILEIGSGQAQAARHLAETISGLSGMKLVQDFAGRDRVVEFTRLPVAD
jgi:release factor glutamine methyltransferase